MTSDDDSDLVRRATVMRGYDELADEYAEARDTFDDTAVLDQLLVDAPSGRVLDAGCGAGDPVLEAVASERAVIGLDLSTEQVRRANDVAPGRVLQGDMTALPVADASVAAVSAFYSLIHVPASQHAAVYAEFARVLRTDGVVLVTTGTDDWSGRNENWLDGGAAMEWDILGRTESVARLEAAGFDVYDSVGVVDDLGEDDAGTGDTHGEEAAGTSDNLVDPDSERADKLFLFARLAR